MLYTYVVSQARETLIPTENVHSVLEGGGCDGEEEKRQGKDCMLVCFCVITLQNYSDHATYNQSALQVHHFGGYYNIPC